MTLAAFAHTKESGEGWLGNIPSHWAIKRLKYVCKILSSNVDKKTLENQKCVVLCNYTDVYYNDEIKADMNFMPATASDEQIAKFSLRADDVVITKDSESADDIAIPAHVSGELPGVVCGYHLAILRPKACMSGKYIKWVFDSRYVRAKVTVLANGLTRVGLSYAAIGGLELPIPTDKAEQIAIACFLDTETAKIDALVAEQRRLIELLKEKRQAVISHAVTKGLNPDAPMKPSGIEWLGDVPEHWNVKPLRSLSNVVRGASPRPAGDARYFNGDFIPWVTVAEITKDEEIFLENTASSLTREGMDESRIFETNTLIYSNSGATLGVPKILAVKGCANDGVVGFQELSEEIDNKYLYFFLASITNAIREKVKQGSGQPNLNTSIVKSLRVPVPPTLQEQKDILSSIRDFCSKHDELLRASNQAISLLQERRTALISAAVTGKIDVRNYRPDQAA